MKSIMSKEWLLENISNEDIVILDVRSDLMDDDKGFNDYKEGHIENAQYLSLKDHLSGEKKEHGGFHPIPDIDKFAEDMKAAGVDDHKAVIAYDEGGMVAARLKWLLNYIGKHNVYILEGGIEAWKESGYPLTKEIKEPKRAESLSVNINEDMVVDIDYVKEAIKNENIVLIDSRSHERYLGNIEPIYDVAGHIPTAVNFPWEETQATAAHKMKNGLKELFNPLKKFDEVIVYCGSGVSGAVNVNYMEEIGLKAKLYAGSYSDWISYKENKVNTGEEPK